jgi:predicted nucleic acid-binding protein
VIVVSNTSPITNLAAVGQFELLGKLYGELHVPVAVVDELHAEGRVWPGTVEIDSAPWIHRHVVGNKHLVEALTRSLGAGEAEAIALAIEIGADLLILDDSDGRKAANGFGLQIIGVLGVLLEGKKAGALPRLEPIIGRLRRDAGFYFGKELETRALQLAGEI